MFLKTIKKFKNINKNNNKIYKHNFSQQNYCKSKKVLIKNNFKNFKKKVFQIKNQLKNFQTKKFS